MQTKYTHHTLSRERDVFVQTYLKAVGRSSKLDALVMMRLKFKNIVLSEKSQKQVRFRVPFMQVKHTVMQG